MRKTGYIVLFACVMCFCSCEVEFDFRDLDGDPLFLMDGNIRTGSHDPGIGNFQMYLYAVPSAAGEHEFSEEARCTLKIYRNSELIDIKDFITIEPFYGLIPDDYPVAPGDEILVTAESDGFPTASAATVIPYAPPVLDVSCSLSGENLKVIFSFYDNGETDDAYAFCFRTTASHGRPDETDIGTAIEIPSGKPSESSFLGIGPFDITWDDGIRYYGLFDDSFNGCRKEVELTFPFGTPPDGMTSYFRIEVQRISRERLRYEIACNDKGNNILGFIGLAPVTFAYTNVSDGSGCLSSANSGYTDWIPVPDTE